MMRTSIKKIGLIAALLVASHTHTTFCRGDGGGGGSSDPLARTNYKNAFEQDEIYKEFSDVLNELGCAENALNHQASRTTAPQEQTTLRKRVYNSCLSLIELAKDLTLQSSRTSVPAAKKRLEQFHAACLDRLQSARNAAIFAPARESLILVSLMLAATYATVKIINPDSMGGSFSISASLFNMAFMFREVIRSCTDYLNPPRDALNRLEEEYALNKCHIPSELHSIIEENFMKARQNPFETRVASDFLAFALGMTAYKKHGTLLANRDAQPIIDELHQRIDEFFANYESIGSSIWNIKLNVAKFIHNLLNQEGETPRYIYLNGRGGIGKTFFVASLTQWIEELLPGFVEFENLVIYDAQELEGSGNKPGALLNVVRNQLAHNKHGSIVFMDEATWLNEGPMISPAKRVFNGDQSQIPTSFFGGGVEKNGVKIPARPMLIFVASNDKIKDEALASRFDHVNFPNPTENALIERACTVLAQSNFIPKTQSSMAHDPEVILSLIRDKSLTSFRAIEANIERLMLDRLQTGPLVVGASTSASLELGL